MRASATSWRTGSLVSSMVSRFTSSKDLPRHRAWPPRRGLDRRRSERRGVEDAGRADGHSRDDRHRARSPVRRRSNRRPGTAWHQLVATRVLIAGVSTRAAAESAAKAGFTVTALDAFGDLDQHPSVHSLSLRRDFGARFTAPAARARRVRSHATPSPTSRRSRTIPMRWNRSPRAARCGGILPTGCVGSAIRFCLPASFADAASRRRLPGWTFQPRRKPGS